MSCSCKGLCTLLHNGYFGNPKYHLGYKYCTECMFSIRCDENLCPCCKVTLRKKARNKSNSYLIPIVS